MNEFSGYEKMPNSFKKMGLEESDFSRMEKLKWVVTEKVHGANFSFIYEHGNLKFAKRREYLNWTDDFFGFQLVVNKIENNMLRLFEQLSTEIPGIKYIVYGELFGGQYPHPKVEAEKAIQAIQTGVYYTPAISFCAFDIAIEPDDVDSKYYLDYERALSYFERFEIFHAKPLFVGKFNEALNFNTRINSPIPGQLGLPELKDNLIEGIVVKPFNQTDADHFASRPIIKIKNPEFDEEEKFHQSEKWSFIPSISSKTEDLSFITNELKNYVTKNRLYSAVSKFGELDRNNERRMEEIHSELLTEVFTDFNENNNDLLEVLSPDEKEWVTERVRSEINKMIVSIQ